ncbi:MAG TPA: TetR/AcrR family transcriptional regulator [Symbiobacteriaceae bacterium]|nr:TetR/AcrR family transcriptional regulator [Symbiobacteriaceae bacterium]
MAQRSGDKYAAILDAAQAVIARQGYQGAQISRIAAEAGVAAGTVYLYFKNKPDLLVSLFRDRLGVLIEQARVHLAEAPHAEEKLRRFIWGHLHGLASRRELAVVTQIEMRQAETDVQEEISQIMKGYFQVIDEIIEEGQRTGVFLPVVDPKQIRNLVFGTLDQTVTAWVLSGFQFDLEAVAEPTYRLITGGVCQSGQGGAHKHGDSGAVEANI